MAEKYDFFYSNSEKGLIVESDDRQRGILRFISGTVQMFQNQIPYIISISIKFLFKLSFKKL